MNILLTGASGFLGSVLYAELQKKHTVYTLGRTEGINTIVCDLSSQIPELGAYKFDTIIHAAGKAHMVPEIEAEKQAFYDVNLQGTKNLLSAVDNLHIKPKSLIFISSVAVYGLNEGENINESTPLNATDPYGHSKILCEYYLKEWGAENGISITILRLPLIAGKNPPGNLQAMAIGIKKGYYFNIKANHARKSIVLAEDVAKLLAATDLPAGTYNLTDGYHPTFKEISKVISSQIRRPLPPELPYWLVRFLAFCGNIIGRKAPLNTSKLKKMVSSLTFDDTQAKEHLNWQPLPVLDNFLIE